MNRFVPRLTGSQLDFADDNTNLRRKRVQVYDAWRGATEVVQRRVFVLVASALFQHAGYTATPSQTAPTRG